MVTRVAACAASSQIEVSRLIDILKDYPQDSQVTAIRQCLYVTSGSDIEAVINLDTGEISN